MEKSKKSINVEVGNECGGWIFFFKINKRDSTFIREMRVGEGRPIEVPKKVNTSVALLC